MVSCVACGAGIYRSVQRWVVVCGMFLLVEKPCHLRPLVRAGCETWVGREESASEEYNPPWSISVLKGGGANTGSHTYPLDQIVPSLGTDLVRKWIGLPWNIAVIAAVEQRSDSVLETAKEA